MLDTNDFPSFNSEAKDIDVATEHNQIVCLLFADDIGVIDNSKKKLLLDRALDRISGQSRTTMPIVPLLPHDRNRL